MTPAKADTKRHHWTVQAELQAARREASLAGSALEDALFRRRKAEEAARYWQEQGIPAERVLDSDSPRDRGFRDPYLHRSPTPEQLAAFEDADRHARGRVEALEAELADLGPFDPGVEAKRAGCPFYAVEVQNLGGRRYLVGEPVPASALADLPGRKVAVITGRGGTLRKVEE